MKLYRYYRILLTTVTNIYEPTKQNIGFCSNFLDVRQPNKQYFLCTHKLETCILKINYGFQQLYTFFISHYYYYTYVLFFTMFVR